MATVTDGPAGNTGGTPVEGNRVPAAALKEAGCSRASPALRVNELGRRQGADSPYGKASVTRWLHGHQPRCGTPESIATVLSERLGRAMSPADLGFHSDHQRPVASGALGYGEDVTASRAQRRGPSPSPDPGARDPRPETRAAEPDVCAADDDTDRSRPAEPAGTSTPDARAPVSAADSAPSGVPGLPGFPEANASPTSFEPDGPRSTPSAPPRAAHVLRTTIAARPSRAPGVRARVAGHLVRLRLPSGRVGDAVLATGELFVNAIELGSPDRGDTVTVERGRGELRVCVADRSSVLPARRTAGGAEEAGGGPTIVAVLTDDRGVAPADPGTRGKKAGFSMALRGES